MSQFIVERISANKAITPHLEITSKAFAEGEKIPQKHTGHGINISPSFDIGNLPATANSLAIVVEDIDSAIRPCIHWLVWDIPVSTHIKEGIKWGVEGLNVFRQHSYCGPYSPREIHRFSFKIYALDTYLNLSDSTEIPELQNAISGHVLGFGEMIGLYN
jgi:hypothetical protein